MYTPRQIATRLTAWENFLNGKDDGPATPQDCGDHWDLDRIAHAAYATGNPELIAQASRALELCNVVMLRDDTRLHDVLMADDAQLEPPARGAAWFSRVTMAELDAALAGV